MTFADIENIWTVDLSKLANIDRGRVYFERAKQVVNEALANPAKLEHAVRGRRFRRAYLVEAIGCQPAVTTQNPKIKQLLADTDRWLGLAMDEKLVAVRSFRGTRSAEFMDLQQTVVTLQRRVVEQDAEIDDLRRKLREQCARG